MAHEIEIKEGVASFAENGRNERAWHKLGQVVDGRMRVAEALKLCHADYNVKLQPIAALNDEIMSAIHNGEMIEADRLLSLIIGDTRATMRMDTSKPLGIVSDSYGIVQNEDAFKFVDLFCTGKFDDTEKEPVIETCGVLGKGERVFITAKLPKQICLDAKREDLIELYVVFTTSHDGSGAVKCMVTPIRVVCNNTLNMAMGNNIGRMSFRHSAHVMTRLDLLKEENAKFAYDALGMAAVYTNALKENFDHLRNIRVSEKDLERIIAEVTLADKAKKVYLETKNIDHEDIPTRSKNNFYALKKACEEGIGQKRLESGNGLWAINGITTYFQNTIGYKSDEVKLDSVLGGNVYSKVNKAHEMIWSLAV